MLSPPNGDQVFATIVTQSTKLFYKGLSEAVALLLPTMMTSIELELH